MFLLSEGWIWFIGCLHPAKEDLLGRVIRDGEGWGEETTIKETRHLLKSEVMGPRWLTGVVPEGIALLNGP